MLLFHITFKNCLISDSFNLRLTYIYMLPDVFSLGKL